jgi:hypothetical protein
MIADNYLRLRPSLKLRGKLLWPKADIRTANRQNLCVPCGAIRYHENSAIM